MYADDTAIYYSHKSIKQIEVKLQANLTNITSWLEDNRLVINMKKGKTETMLFGTEKRLSNLNNQRIDIEYNGLKVNFTSCYKFFEIHLKPSLNIKDHVNKAYRKASGQGRI